MMTEREQLLKDVAIWAENNPYVAYGDYRDELSKEQVELLLEDRQKFDEDFWEIECRVMDYADWSDHEKELLDTFRDRIFAAYRDCFPDDCEADEIEWEELPDEITETDQECRYVDCSDVLDTMLRNTRVNIVAIPEKRNGEEIAPPNFELDAEENRKRNRYLKDTFGMDGWKAESCYYHERLKVMGRLDLREVYEKGKPVAITIEPGDSLIFHTSWNGSGCLGDVETTTRKTFKASFQCDDADKYGVQEVYGFIGEVWRNTLNVSKFEPWD